MRDVYFVRHGQSTANIGLPAGRHSEIPLTDKGVAQAARVAGLWQRTPDVIISSPFLRARNTAAHLRERYPDVAYEEWPIQEVSILADDIDAPTPFEHLRPRVEAFWNRLDPDYVEGPGAESHNMFLDRVLACLTRLRARPEPHLVLFCHGQFMRVLLWFALFAPDGEHRIAMDRYRQLIHVFMIPNTAILHLRYDHTHPHRPHVLGLYAEHLSLEDWGQEDKSVIGRA